MLLRMAWAVKAHSVVAARGAAGRAAGPRERLLAASPGRRKIGPGGGDVRLSCTSRPWRAAARALPACLLSLAAASSPVGRGAAASLQAPAAVSRLLGSGNLPGSQVSALFVDGAGGTVLYARNASLELPPASTLKLLVTTTALADLGAGYRFTTRVQGRVGSGGTVSGDLYLIGSGDPVFSDGDLEALARQVARRVRRIDGSVLVDGSLFAGGYGKGWAAQNAQYGWSALPEALTLDQGQIVAVVRPAARSGSLPNAQPVPAGSLVEDSAVTTAAGTADSLAAYWPGGGRAGIVIRGDIPLGSPPVRLAVSVPNPDAWAAAAFRADLEAAGVRVLGGVGSGVAPRGLATLASHVSSSLAAILVHQDRWSINVSAEDLLRVIGAQMYGRPGTVAKGVRAEEAWLRSQGIAWSGVIVDGCGLSLDDRVSAQDLVNLLVRARTEPWFPRLIGALPVAGAAGQVGGTLGEIGLFTGFRGHVWAKTGDVGNAENLAGYIRTASGQWVVFAALVNGQPSWLAGWRAEEAAVAAVAVQ